MDVKGKPLADVLGEMDREYNRDLNKAINIGIASLAGALIPVIGLILAIVALVIGSGVPKNIRTERKKNTLTMIVIIGIGLSLIAGGLYYIFYSNLQTQAEAQRQAQVQQFESEQKTQTAAKNYRQLELSACLEQADTAYWDYVKVNAASATPQANGTTLYRASTLVWDTADKNKTTEKDECYRRYPSP